MAVNPGLAHLSDTLFTTAIATYTLAIGAYTAEYAFGRRGRIAATTTMAMARERILVGAGAPLPTEEWPPKRVRARSAADLRPVLVGCRRCPTARPHDLR